MAFLDPLPKKKTQIGINITREGIGHDLQVQDRLRVNNRRGKWKSIGEKGWGAWEELQHHHNMKPEQADVKSAEWRLHHPCR
jgi:hypothetical protein